jgi:hypothetical protein
MLLGVPPEVFQKVMPYCDTLDVKALESTCRQARIYCNWPQFWQTRLREDFGFDTLRFPNENGATSKEMYNQLWYVQSPTACALLIGLLQVFEVLGMGVSHRF